MHSSMEEELLVFSGFQQFEENNIEEENEVL